MKMSHAVLAFYHFCTIHDPHQEVEKWKIALNELEAHGRIYFSFEGINAQLSLPTHRYNDFKNWLDQTEHFSKVDIKIHEWPEATFEKLIIKFRQQLVAFDTPVDLNLRGQSVEPLQWKKMLEERDNNTVLLDVRNQYEYDLGHFEGAIAPESNHFRDYKNFAEKFCESHDPESTKVMMCCTGGIRCEIFSSYLVEKGFKNVFQLNGGIIQYGLKVGSDYWKGKLFVFDDRMAIPISQDSSTTIALCRSCKIPNDQVYNCANTNCNEMFTCCNSCLTELKGCCSTSCSQSSRLRPLEDQNPHKPYRKWHHYREKQLKKDSP
jgi:UPF0176 protein